MQSELYSAGGAIPSPQVSTGVTAGPHVQSINAVQPITSEKPDAPSITASAVTTVPEESLVSFSRRRVPSETEATVTTDVVTLSMESSANLRHRFGGTDKSNGLPLA